jgi:hypothetical protein
MNKYELHALLHKLAEDEFENRPIDLWPSLKESMKNSPDSLSGDVKMKKTGFDWKKNKWSLATGIIFALMLVFLFITPQGRVFAQDIVKFFTRLNDNQKPVPTLAATLQSQEHIATLTPLPEGTNEESVREGCGSIIRPLCSMKEVQELISFDLMVFSQDPPGLDFIGAMPYEDGALLSYSGEKGSITLVEQSIEVVEPEMWSIGKDATVTSTWVNGEVADYVEGSWVGRGVPDDTVNWDENIPTRTLIWQAGSMHYVIIHAPARGARGPDGYDREQLVTIAESLGNGSDEQLSVQEEASIQLHEAEEKAGFSYIVPDWLPAGLSLQKTQYNSEHNAICRYYTAKSDLPEFPTLVIAQSNWALPELEEIQTKAYYDGKQIEIVVHEEYLPLEKADGDQGLLYETGLQIHAFCGGETASAHRVLLWRQGFRTFVVFSKMDTLFGSNFITKQEMIHIADQLNGVIGEDEGYIPDRERLTSWEEAQELVDFSIKYPTKMLSNVYFSHISIGIMDSPNRVVTYYTGEENGAGGDYHLMIVQTSESESSLENRRLAGGYRDAAVNGQPAIYKTSCGDSALSEASCIQNLIWYEGNTEFYLETNFLGLVPEENIIAIAESMQ